VCPPVYVSIHTKGKSAPTSVRVLVLNDPITRYCALACYKQHNDRCVESFHGDNLGDAMKGLSVEDEEKR